MNARLLIVLIAMLVSSAAHAQKRPGCEWINGKMVCPPAQQVAPVTVHAETEVGNDEVFGASVGDTLSDGSVVVDIQETVTYSSAPVAASSRTPFMQRGPARRLALAPARVVGKLFRGVAQFRRRNVARRQAALANWHSRRAKRAQAKFNAVRRSR